MNDRCSSAEIFQRQADGVQLRKWREEEQEQDNTVHLQRCVKTALETELTDKQRQYYLMYFQEGKTMEQIAKEFGVSKSTVSRTVRRANLKMGRCLRYADPRLLNAPVQERNRRVWDGEADGFCSYGERKNNDE